MGKDDWVMKTPGFGWRVAVTILVALLWLAFLVIWLFFYAQNFTIYQNIAVFFVSLLIVGAIKAAMWAPWGMKYGPACEAHYAKYNRPRRTSARRIAKKKRKK